MKAWPFLVSTSPNGGYRVVAAPDFITEAKAEREIIRASHDDFHTEDGHAIYLRGYREGLGPINIVLRSRPGTARMLGKTTDEPLTDGAGRSAWVSEGIVLRHEGKEPFTDAQLDAALESSKEHFARFWEDKESRNWRAVSLPSFELPPAETGAKPLTITYKQSPTLPQAAPATLPPTPNVSARDVHQAYGDHERQDELEQEKKKWFGWLGFGNRPEDT